MKPTPHLTFNSGKESSCVHIAFNIQASDSNLNDEVSYTACEDAAFGSSSVGFRMESDSTALDDAMV